MGHKINPLVFRLGAANTWNLNLKQDWILNYLVYQLVSNQFLRYTIPYFNRDKRRNKRHTTGLVIMKGERQLRENNFIKRSMLFSHLLLASQNNKLEISCFFFDYKLKFRNRDKEFVVYNQLFSNVYLRWSAYRAFFVKSVRKQKRSSFRFLRKMIPNFWFFNLNLILVRNNLNKFNQDILKLNRIWLRLVSKLGYFNKKKKIFFLNAWSYLISGLLVIFKRIKLTSLSNRLYLILMQINLFNFNAKLHDSLFFVSLFRTRYFLFKGLSKSIGQNLRSLFNSEKNLTIKYHAIRERKVTSSLLTNLILVKLGQYYRINSILYPLVTWIKRHKNILGFRIIVSGRLTRRERASHIIKSGKSMPLSSLQHKIDYYQDSRIMKFGMVGIKTYLFVKKKMRNSYYFFKFVLI